MSELDYEQYHQKGGNYVIPVEVFNELFEENQELKKQLEYLNQLRFERDMLDAIIQNGEVSKEDKEFIDMTHRNTELLEENQELKKQKQEWINLLSMFKNQQKEFIEYLTNYIKLLNDKPDLIEECQQDILKEALYKFKEIIGGQNENNT